METINIPFDKNDVVDKYNYDNGKVFYLGYENEPTKRVSILFPNWDWVKERFGDNFERLNDGRKNEIAILQTCLKHNIPRYEYETIVNFDTADSDGVYRRKQLNKQGNAFVQEFVNGQFVDKVIVFKPTKLSDNGRQRFEENIAKGLLVLCRLV